MLTDSFEPSGGRLTQIHRALLLREGSELHARDLPPRLRAASGGGDDSLASGDTTQITLGQAIVRATERIERRWIQNALSEHRGNRTAAAEALGINRKTLFNKMRAYGFGDDGTLAGALPALSQW